MKENRLPQHRSHLILFRLWWSASKEESIKYVSWPWNKSTKGSYNKFELEDLFRIIVLELMMCETKQSMCFFTWVVMVFNRWLKRNSNLFGGNNIYYMVYLYTDNEHYYQYVSVIHFHICRLHSKKWFVCCAMFVCPLFSDSKESWSCCFPLRTPIVSCCER